MNSCKCFYANLPNFRTIVVENCSKVWGFEIIGHLRCLVVRVPGYRSRDPGSIPSATRCSEKYWVWYGVHSAS
jgi:hypothetical protein